VIGVFLLIVILAGVLTGLGFLVWYVVAAPESQVLGTSIVRGPEGSRKIALTFDDGPGEATPAVLDLLRQAEIRATFFLCGQNVERYPELARRIAEEGHEIGNHTYSHPRLLGRTPGKIAWEIELTQNIIAHRTGRTPTLFRPPYGLRWFGLFRVLKRNRLTSVMWSVNSLDWKRPHTEIVQRVIRETQPGAIILFHDGVRPRKSGNRQVTVEALRDILHATMGRFECVPVSEL
jgi:peptidoglycan/xylan/chitin deacetylase (PgdA/CDA1 family)